jgi:hypothetical protein
MTTPGDKVDQHTAEHSREEGVARRRQVLAPVRPSQRWIGINNFGGSHRLRRRRLLLQYRYFSVIELSVLFSLISTVPGNNSVLKSSDMLFKD